MQTEIWRVVGERDRLAAYKELLGKGGFVPDVLTGAGIIEIVRGSAVLKYGDRVNNCPVVVGIDDDPHDRERTEIYAANIDTYLAQKEGGK
jgi:hypothetical protein